MKQLLGILFILLLSFSANSQCFDLVKNEGFQMLDTSAYIFDGRLDAAQISNRDSYIVVKTFFRGRNYKIVTLSESENEILVVMKDQKGNLVFTNKKDKSNKVWEFYNDTNRILSIELSFPKGSREKEKTCVAVLVGLAM